MATGLVERTTREKLLDSEIDESWMVQAQLAWERYVESKTGVDPIELERQKLPFINGFIQAGRLPPFSEVVKSQCIPLDPSGIIHLHRRLMPYIMMFGHHANIAPGDMMAALLICVTTVGRQMHSSFTHQQVFEVFGAEAAIILRAIDHLQSSKGETKH